MEWLTQRAGPRVGLIGHSLGAVKCLYALAQEPRLAVACVIAVSPPRLSYSWFCSGPRRCRSSTIIHGPRRSFGRTGRAGPALDVKLPLPFVITAAGYVEKYGPDERYNYLRFMRSVPCPALVSFGATEVENNMAFALPPKNWRNWPRDAPHCAS